MARQNSDLVAIFRDGPTRDREATLGKHRHNVLVAEGMPGVLAAHDLGDRLAHAFVANRLAIARRVAGGEEILQLEEAARRSQVFSRDRPAYRRLVHANCLGHFAHRHGP